MSNPIDQLIEECNSHPNDIPENILKIKDSIVDIHQRMNFRSNYSVLVCGKAQQGKSCLLDLISGKDLISKRRSDGGKLIIQLLNQEISEENLLLPKKWGSSDLMFWELTLSEDFETIDDLILKAYQKSKILSLSTNFKIVLVFRQGIEKDSKGKNLVELFCELNKIVPDNLLLFNAISIVITFAKGSYTTEKFCNMLRKLANENNRAAKSKELLLLIAENPSKISLFRKPKEEGVISDSVRQDIVTKIDQCKYIPIEADNMIFESSRLNLIKLVDQQRKIIAEYFVSLSLQLKTKFSNCKNLELQLELNNFLKGDYENSNSFLNSLDHINNYFFDSIIDISKIREQINEKNFYEKFLSVSNFKTDILSWMVPIQKLKEMIDLNISTKKQKDFEEEETKKQKIRDAEIKLNKDAAIRMAEEAKRLKEKNEEQDRKFQEKLRLEEEEIKRLRRELEEKKEIEKHETINRDLGVPSTSYKNKNPSYNSMEYDIGQRNMRDGINRYPEAPQPLYANPTYYTTGYDTNQEYLRDSEQTGFSSYNESSRRQQNPSIGRNNASNQNPVIYVIREKSVCELF